MVWDLSPIAFTLDFGSFQFPVRWYGLLFASTFVYGILFFRYLFRKEGKPVDEVYDLVLWIIGGTVIGARLGYVLFYNPAFYLTHPLKILALRDGGLASHGAILGILAGVWLYSRRATGQSFLWVCDRIGMAVPLSGFLIRLGNFCNSEIIGRPTDLPWAVVFARVDLVPRHPVQLYEAFSYLAIFLLQFRDYLRNIGRMREGELFGRFFLFVYGARFVFEFFKTPQAAFETGWPLTVGQWLSVPAVLFGAYMLRRARRSKS